MCEMLSAIKILGILMLLNPSCTLSLQNPIRQRTFSESLLCGRHFLDTISLAVPTMLKGRYYSYAHPTNEEKKAQRSSAVLLKVTQLLTPGALIQTQVVSQRPDERLKMY